MQDFFKEIKINSKVNLEDIQEELFSKKNENAIMDQSNLISGVPARFKHDKFDSYPISFLNEIKTFSVAPNNDKVFLIYGPVGTGKTTLLCSAIHERALRGIDVGTYLSLRLLNPTIRTSRSFTAKESEMAFYERLSKEKFLCLDEIGTCDDQTLERNFLRTIIALRYDNCLPTMMATNLNTKQFKAFLLGDLPDNNDPIMDRLNSIIIPKLLDGNSHRGEN